MGVLFLDFFENIFERPYFIFEIVPPFIGKTLYIGPNTGGREPQMDIGLVWGGLVALINHYVLIVI
jgi:hypothetical protein